MPPRITQNDKRERTGRIPGQTERVQRQTRTTYETAKQLPQSQQGRIQYGPDAPSAYRVDPSVATSLVNALRPLGKIVEQGTEVRDRIDKEKFDDVFLFAQSTNANPDLGYEEKLNLISKAYSDFKPMSRKYQIAAHTQKTKVMQELNGIQDKLRFSDWSTKTIQESMKYPVNPQDDSMSREEFLMQSAADLRANEPQFSVQTMLWADGQQQQIYKKQFDALNTFSNLQADIILKSKNPDFFSLAGNENQFKAELETALVENGYDPRDILENEAIMEGINSRYAAYKTTGNTIASKRASETNLISSLINAQTNDQNQPALLGKGVSPTRLANLIVTEGIANSPNPDTFFIETDSQFSAISRVRGKPSTQIVEELSAFPIMSYSEEDQELVKAIRENPSYLDDMYGDSSESVAKYKAVEKALSATENLMKYEFRNALGKDAAMLLNRPDPEDFDTKPVAVEERTRVTDVLDVINKDKGTPDDRLAQIEYVENTAMYYETFLKSTAEYNQYTETGEGVGEPTNRLGEYETARISQLREDSNFQSKNPTEENLQARKTLVEELNKKGLLRSTNEVRDQTRFFSESLQQLSEGIAIGGGGTLTGGRQLNGVVIASGQSGIYGDSDTFIEAQESFLQTRINTFAKSMFSLDIDDSLRSQIQDVLDLTKDNAFDAITAFELINNNMKINPDDAREESFRAYKRNYEELVRGYARQVQSGTEGLITSNDDQFKLNNKSKAMIPFLSGSVASSQAFDARSGGHLTSVSAKASDMLAKQISDASSQMRADMAGEDFNVEEYRKNSSQMFTAITQLYGTDMRSPVLSGLRSSLVEFTAAYLGIPENITSAISDPDTEASRNIILRDFLLNNGRSLTALNESQRRAVSSVTEGFQSFFVDANNQNAPLSFLPDFNNILRMSDVQTNQGQTLDSPDVLANNAFNLGIDPTSFQSNDLGVSLVSTEVQAGFANDISQSIVQGVLNDHEIRYAFLEDSKLHTSLLTSVRNAAGMTGGLNDSTRTEGSSTDLVLDELDRADKRLVISIVKAEGKGNPNVNAMVGASLKAAGADADTLAAMGGYAFHTEVIQGTPDDKNRIQFVPFNLSEQEKFKSDFAAEASSDISIVQTNTNLSRVSVPAQSLQKVLWNFDQLFTVTNKYGVLDKDNQGNMTITMNGKENLFRKPLRGSTPEPYLDIVKILATPAGPYQLLAGRTFKDGAGKSYTESGMSLFGLNQVAVLYQATKAIVEEKGVKAGLTYLKEIHDRYQRTDNTGKQTSIYAYVNNEGEFLYMGEEKGQPVFVGGERLDGREIIQKETQEFIDNILLTTERTDIKTGQFDRSNPRFRIFQTHNEQEQIRIEQAQREANRMSNRGASWLFSN